MRCSARRMRRLLPRSVILQRPLPLEWPRSRWPTALRPPTERPRLVMLRSRMARAQTKAPTRGRSATVPAGHERQPLEQMDVLLVLEQCAVQRRDQLLWVTLAQRLGADVLDHQ